MLPRKIIKIDEEKCNGCGQCVPSCAEGAIQIIDGKARLVADNLCDGLGACLGECPRGALTIEEREADAFDEQAVQQRRESLAGDEACCSAPAGCPGSQARTLRQPQDNEEPGSGPLPAGLKQWPIQLALLSPKAPFLRNRRLLLAADCALIARPDLQQQLLRDAALAIGCPKLDDAAGYVRKLAEIIRSNDTPEINILLMNIPCCSGLLQIAREAVRLSGAEVRLRYTVVAPEGQITGQGEV